MGRYVLAKVQGWDARGTWGLGGGMEGGGMEGGGMKGRGVGDQGGLTNSSHSFEMEIYFILVVKRRWI